MTSHYRQASHASSFISTSANSHSGLGIRKPHNAKIGPWKIGRALGKGSTGRVFLATNSETGQKAAVKIVSKDSLIQDQQNQSDDKDSAGLSYGIEREIIIMKLLNHKNVLRLYDVWETDKQLYLILEYVEGGELFDLLVESGPLPEATAINFFKQIILGASYCHNLGICHRDLKPENILLDKDLNIKIADFGMAALESGRLLETSCGSPHYAAPEIVSGLQYHGAESDVWSCGVILFAILTGRLPFDDDNIRDLLLKVQVGKFEIVENLSPEAKDLIHQMLTVDPSKRIKTKDILKHPLVKKYYNCDEDEDYINLPSIDCATKPVATKDQIDEKILENLVILWHGRTKESIVESLMNSESNPEKTFYFLLLQYRHEHAGSKENDGLVRSTSIISKVTNSTSNSSNLSKKRFSFAASSSRRPTSFQSFRNSKSRDSFHTYNVPQGVPPPNFGPAYQDYLIKTSTANNSQQSTPSNKSILPHSGSKSQRNSMLFSSAASVMASPTKRASILSSMNELRQPPPPPPPVHKTLKRNSITSKVLSSYAKMAEYEQRNNPKEFGKRTSQDFAALCDALFNDGSKNNVTIPNSESMATINAIVFGNKKRASKRLSMAVQAKKRGLPNEPIEHQKDRNISDPISRISKLLTSKDIPIYERRTVSELPTSTLAGNPPPKPISKLDPRYKAYEAYEKRVSQDAARLLAQAEEQAALEAAEREEQEQRELEDLQARKAAAAAAAAAAASEQEETDLHQSNTVLRNRQVPSRLSDVHVPQVTRLSKIGDKDRYSVLSMYSTKQSSNRLSFYLKELDNEIAKSSNSKKNDRISRMSLIALDEDDQLDENEDTNTMNGGRSWGTLNEEDDDTEDTSVDNGKSKSALVTPTEDDGLFFVDKSNTPSRGLSVTTPLANANATAANNTTINDTNTSSHYPSMVEKNSDAVKDSFITDYSEDVAYKVNKLPEIPGSPDNGTRGRSNTTETFEIFEDAIRRSKQEFESPEKEKANQNQQGLDIEKQRRPLDKLDSNNKFIKGDKRKSSFFRNLSQGSNITPSERRKSSFGETLKALFGPSAHAKPVVFDTILTLSDGFQAVESLLKGWKSYGVSNLEIDTRHHKIEAGVVKNNSLNIKPVKFACQVMESGRGSSKLVFTHTKGSAKSFDEIIKATRKIFVNEEILA